MSISGLFDSKFSHNQASYMMVTVLAILDNLSPTGSSEISKITAGFKKFYQSRVKNGKLAEKPNMKMSKVQSLSDGDIKALMLAQPLHALRDLISFDEQHGILQFRQDLVPEMNRKTKRELRKTAFKHLFRYFKGLDSNQLTVRDLEDLPLDYAVSAIDVAAVSGQNQMKGIHPVDREGYKGVIILCTLAGESYANSWLDENETILKYYLEGRTQADGTKVYNEQARSNQSVVASREEGFPLHVFTRDKKGELFHYAGQFLYDRIEEETSGDKYFVLNAMHAEGGERPMLPGVSRQEIIDAMTVFDRKFRGSDEWQGWETRGTQKFAVVHEERRYPPKQIISIATGVPVSDFSGGTQSNSYLEQRGFEIIEMEPPMSVSMTVQHLHNYIAAQGFVFEEDLIRNFFLSLKSKPFVILAGISGTGKSKIGELLAGAVGATTDNGRYSLIPVRPDWNDSGDLLGYQNLRGEFIDGPLIRVIRKAMSDRDKPYFVCLDEMNLARVEYYFSDFLSIIESRKIGDGNIVSFPIPLNGLKEVLIFPENLYVIGTVNMDETTHSFSRKVLDRANTIELTDVSLSNFPGNLEAVMPMDRDNDFFKSEYLLMRDCYQGNEGYLKEKVALLERINQILVTCGFQVGYRVRDEFCFYLLYNKRWGLLTEDKAIDFQIMQKILPRIQGSAMEIETVLTKLKEFCEAKYPASLKKADFMLGRLQSDGFTSFWP